MKKIFILAVFVVFVCGLNFSFAQEPFGLTVAGKDGRFALKFEEPRFMESSDSMIENIVVFNDRSGLAFTRSMLFRTDDAGATWRTLPVPKASGQRLASVLFESQREGLVLLADLKTSAVEVARTTDGGSTWTKNSATLENAAEFELNLESAELTATASGVLRLSIRIPTSSNFTGRAEYQSNDDGLSWQFIGRSIELRSDSDASAKVQKGKWSLETTGGCSGFKTGCVQGSTLRISGLDATPPQLQERIKIEKEAARGNISNTQIFALPPGGSTRISLNRGFDKCANGTVTQMQTWWDNSYFFDANIYFSGRNRACSQTLSAAWVNQVSAMGWGLIPTVVGYQSPCTSSTTTAKLSYDAAVSEQQGRGEADIAVADAANIGLTAGSIIYYDMERYDPPTPDTLGCRPATVAFLKGWTDRIKELGYTSGTYGSPKNAIEDWQFMPPASRMDAVWMARWDNVPSVWTYISFANFPANVWDNHQRIKQWQAPHNE
ncbi:MAG: glycoside hydrolase domain-containing protein, partial [Pyrinomonadaceae bacterium]